VASQYSLLEMWSGLLYLCYAIESSCLQIAIDLRNQNDESGTVNDRQSRTCICLFNQDSGLLSVKAFEKWMVSEVLPGIHKTAAYVHSQSFVNTLKVVGAREKTELFL
jgi:hypothetical protein